MNIGFRCICLAERKRTRSHGAYFLFNALKKRDDIKVYDLDTSLIGDIREELTE